MTTPILIFVCLAVALIALLAWVVRPPKKTLLSVDDVLNALSEKRHYARLPQILQSLREEDSDFLETRGYDQLASRLRRERKSIALRYLNSLEEEYQLLLEASRILAQTAPEVSATDEWGRFRQGFRFVLYCRYLRWRLRFGLQPWDVFGILSDMEGEMTLKLEVAAARIGERAAMAGEFPLFLENRGGDSD
jgi:hypothetical protein